MLEPHSRRFGQLPGFNRWCASFIPSRMGRIWRACLVWVLNIGHVLVEEPFRMDSERAFSDFTGDCWRARGPHYLVVAGTGTSVCIACRVGGRGE